MVRAHLEQLQETLSALKREGVTRVAVSEENLARLRSAVARLQGKSAAAPEKSAEEISVAKKTPGSPAPGRRAEEISPDARPNPERPREPVVFPKISPQEKAASPAKPVPVKAPVAIGKPLPPSPEVVLPEGDKKTRMAWLRERVLGDPTCLEHVKPGKKLVFGTGTEDAEIFFCGEAPGAEEETEGEPFVGPAGELLTKIIAAMGLSREQVYIGNIMKWRPEMPTPIGNRPPTAEEMAFCLPFLRAQLEIVRPKVIVALGATAIEGLLGPDPGRRIGKIHGQWHAFNGIPLMPTYHPSYLSRNGTNRSKRVVWEDLLRVMEKIGLPVSERQRGFFLAK